MSIVDDMKREHEAKIRQILQEKLNRIEDTLALCVDPATALTVIFDQEVTKIELEHVDVFHLSPDEYLKALDNTEEWYRVRNYPYPYPERLKEQRAYWENKKNNAN